MKAVLILPEMPEKCDYCPVGEDTSIGWKKCVVCKPVHKCVESIEIEHGRPDWCPLRQMPSERKVTDEGTEPYVRGIAQGFNLCLRAIEWSEEDDV